LWQITDRKYGLEVLKAVQIKDLLLKLMKEVKTVRRIKRPKRLQKRSRRK